MPSDGLTSLLLLLGIFGTAVFVIRVILMFTGAAVEGLDGDIAIDADVGDLGDVGDVPDGTGDAHGSTRAFNVLNLQTISAFAMGAGWFGLAVWHRALGFEASAGVALLLGSAFGVFLAWLQIWVLKKLLVLQSSGARFDPTDAVDLVGQVYLRIPEHDEGAGKVRVAVTGSMRILPAVSEGEGIDSFKSVRVKSVRSDGTLVVHPVES
jgi:hypothetical protein